MTNQKTKAKKHPAPALVHPNKIAVRRASGLYCRQSAQLALLLAVPRVRFVFSSESVKDVQLESGGPPGQYAGAAGWRAVTRVLRSSRTAMGGAVADLVNVIFPSDCRVCGAPMVALSKAQVCEACVARVGAQTDVLCSRCGDALGMESARFAAGMGMTECTMCRLAPPEFAKAVAFAVYDDEVREMLHLLKFNGMRRVADHILGDSMAAAILKLEGEAANDLVVVPVPLFASRQRSRGFNQAEVLAEAGLARLRRLRPEWKLRMSPGVLQRVRDTRPLFVLDPGARRKSLRGAFRVERAEEIRGREILLVDDILTTGATARECARVLMRAGAAKVWVATVARAQAESVRGSVNGFVNKGAGSVARWDMKAAVN